MDARYHWCQYLTHQRMERNDYQNPSLDLGENLYALEALIIHSDWLANLTFTVATFHYAERVVTVLTEIVE